jgi:hypothetical protein
MKTVFLTLLLLLTGCSMNPYRMANYDIPNTAAYAPGSVNSHSPSGNIGRSSVTVTSTGNYVVIPNYSSGGLPAAIIHSGR